MTLGWGYAHWLRFALSKRYRVTNTNTDSYWTEINCNNELEKIGSHDLTVTEAFNMAQNRLLWRLLAIWWSALLVAQARTNDKK